MTKRNLHRAAYAVAACTAAVLLTFSAHGQQPPAAAHRVRGALTF